MSTINAFFPLPPIPNNQTEQPKIIKRKLDGSSDYAPVLPFTPQLNFHGGRILRSPRFASIFLGNFWQSSRGKEELRFHNNFAHSILKSRYTSIWSEYGSGKGTFLGARVLDRASPRRINDSKIQQAIRQSYTKNPLPGSNNQTVYTIYLPPGTVLEVPGGISSLEGVAGYHSSFFDGKGQRIYYSVLVYSDHKNGIDFTGSSKDNMTVTASHEWTEAVTDPNVSNGRLGWYDNNLGEVSDIPLSLGMSIEEVVDKVDGYYVQKNWSNRDQAVEAVSRDSIDLK